MKILILFTMLFLHIVDDYYLQGILAKMKQKSWWEQNVNDSSGLYRHDYLVALIEHAFSWTFMVMLPVMCWMIYKNQICIGAYCVYFVCNLIIHAYVDNIKANRKSCSLLDDQMIHLGQIIFTWATIFQIV